MKKASTKKLIMAKIECALDEVIEQHHFNNKEEYSTCHTIDVLIKARCQSDDTDYDIICQPKIEIPGAAKLIR